VAKHRATRLDRTPAKPLPSPELIKWFQDRLREWAVEHGRDFPWRHTTDEYRIVVTEILLQQTTATAVAALWEQFFTELPSWQSLDRCSDESLRELVSRLGLVNQRTRRLKQLARWVVENDGVLPCNREELEQVPGIGQYVASALLAVKYGQPEPLLDVNMARVLERFFGERELADIRDDPWLQTVARVVVADSTNVNWSLLDFAASTCRARNPDCARLK
jgi:A/G-specific adenine glycosylase